MKSHNIDFWPTHQHNQDRKKNPPDIREKNKIASYSKDTINKKLHKAKKAEFNFTEQD